MTTGLSEVLSTFTTFYRENARKRSAFSNQIVSNEEYRQFMRTLGDGRIRGLSELCHFYLAINGQSDVISHIILSKNKLLNVYVFVIRHQKCCEC